MRPLARQPISWALKVRRDRRAGDGRDESSVGWDREAQIAAILPAVDLPLARDGRRNLAWFLGTLIALFGSQLLLAR